MDLAPGGMQPWRWYLCRLNKALVKCKGQHSQTTTPCRTNPKCNLANGSLVFCILGHVLHSGESKYTNGPGPYERYAADKTVLYFCTSPSCTNQFVHKPHPKSKGKLNHFCLSRDAPSIFRSPIEEPRNIVLCPTTQLDNGERVRINQGFGTRF